LYKQRQTTSNDDDDDVLGIFGALHQPKGGSTTLDKEVRTHYYFLLSYIITLLSSSNLSIFVHHNN